MAALSLYSIWKKERSVQFLIIITLILSLVSLIALFYVGQTGGQIRHNEFRSDSSRQYILEHQKDKVNLD
jgi:ABC-type maltose transport system permease subunit